MTTLEEYSTEWKQFPKPGIVLLAHRWLLPVRQHGVLFEQILNPPEGCGGRHGHWFLAQQLFLAAAADHRGRTQGCVIADDD